MNAPEAETYFFLLADRTLIRRAREAPEQLVELIRLHESRAARYVRECFDLRGRLARTNFHKEEFRSLRRQLAFFKRLALAQAGAPRLSLPLAPRASG